MTQLTVSVDLVDCDVPSSNSNDCVASSLRPKGLDPLPPKAFIPTIYLNTDFKLTEERLPIRFGTTVALLQLEHYVTELRSAWNIDGSCGRVDADAESITCRLDGGEERFPSLDVTVADNSCLVRSKTRRRESIGSGTGSYRIADCLVVDKAV